MGPLTSQKEIKETKALEDKSVGGDMHIDMSEQKL